MVSHIVMGHGIDRHPEGAWVVEEERDVLKDDAFLWEIWDVTDFLLDALSSQFSKVFGVPYRSQRRGSTSRPC